MYKLIVFSKNGTLITPRSPSKFVQSPEDQILLPNVAATIARYREERWSMAIVSNQDRCDSINTETGRPFKSLDEAEEEMQFAMALTGIGRSLFCPKRDGSLAYNIEPGGIYNLHKVNHRFRKPDAGMLLFFKNKWTIDPFIFVGDRLEDEAAAVAAGVEFQWAKDFFGWRS